MEERKASEVLLEIEKNIKLLLKYYQTLDLNIKLILDRLNKSNKATAEQAMIPKKSIAQSTAQPHISAPSVSAGPLIPKEASYEFKDVDENGNEQIKEELQSKPGRRDVRTPLQQGKKTQIQQKIVYPDGKNVILANVEIYITISNAKGNPEKKVIKQTRTNSSGKWTAALDPGRYSVHVFKAALTEKPVVERNYEILVPLSETPMELDQSEG